MKTDDITFYWTLASGGNQKALRDAQDRDDVPSPQSCMVSHATRTNQTWPGPDWFIDSGGYSILHGMREFPTSPEEYVRWVHEQEQQDDVTIQRFALRDWACEDDILRKWGRTVEQHQDWTIRDHIRCLDEADRLGLDAEPVAVLQGYDVRDYLRQVDRLQDHGLMTDHLGIGSICRRNATAQIRNTVLRVREAVPARVTLHGFGVKQQVLGHPDILAALDSVDSNAWDNIVTWGKYQDPPPGPPVDDLNEWPDTDDEGRQRNTGANNLVAYRGYRQRLQDVLSGLPAASDLDVVSISDYHADPDRRGYVLLKCRCGNILDPGDPDPDAATCRFCDRARCDVLFKHLEQREDFFRGLDWPTPEEAEAAVQEANEGREPMGADTENATLGAWR